MADISRRMLAKGTIWSVPVIVATATAPAMAASPCNSITKGSPLPYWIFTPKYLGVTSQTFGGVANKVLSTAMGLSVDPKYATCLPGVTYTISKSDAPSSITLTNRTNYRVGKGGTLDARTGTVGKPGNCGGDGTAEVCGTVIGQGVDNSKNTSDYNPQAYSFSLLVNVPGYGTTQLYMNAGGFSHINNTWEGIRLTISDTPAVPVPAA